MDQNGDNLFGKFMLSVQGALLGKITNRMRAVAVGWEGKDKIMIKLILDREPTQFDYDLLTEIVAEVIAEFPKIDVVEECEYSSALPKEFVTNKYRALAFHRYEKYLGG